MNRANSSSTQAAAARQAASGGDFVGAIALATEALRTAPDYRLMTELVGWRLKGFAAMAHPPGRAVWPPSLPDPYPGLTGIPEIPAAALTADVLGGAILHHGSLRVNGLVSPDKAEDLRLGIERALAARDAYHEAAAQGGTGLSQRADPDWYVPADVAALAQDRPWVENGGGMLYTLLTKFIPIVSMWEYREGEHAEGVERVGGAQMPVTMREESIG